LLSGILAAAQQFDFRLDQVSALMHGTTIATNAVLERKLPPGALITTQGFEDVLEIGRHVRREIYSLRAEQRTLLIPRQYRFGVRERVSAAGAISEALDESAIPGIVEKLRGAGIQAIAVCLLHAYANPLHEQRLGELLQAVLPDACISLSSVISPEIREFERCSTVVLNALLMPVVGRYLERLRARLQAAGLRAPVYLVQSNGGVTTPETAAVQPARLLLSGPSGGALAAQTLSRQLGEPNLIAADMGGTSFDVSIVHDGSIRLITQGEVADCPVRLPMVEIRTIGAGGGSLARVDSAGRLHVGPESAGALPGPVAYGRGGVQPAVTDANALLGRLDPDYFLGGAMALDVAGATQALEQQVAQPL
jgi:N-methylhydantoinase A